jgi:hypothetical protein
MIQALASLLRSYLIKEIYEYSYCVSEKLGCWCSLTMLTTKNRLHKPNLMIYLQFYKDRTVEIYMYKSDGSMGVMMCPQDVNRLPSEPRFHHKMFPLNPSPPPQTRLHSQRAYTITVC